MNVKNINGTSRNQCKCGSWLKHWKNFNGGNQSNSCAAFNCYNEQKVGAHIQKEKSSCRAWYIIPLCAKHNAQKGKSITIYSFTKLVSANVNKTCGKQKRH